MKQVLLGSGAAFVAEVPPPTAADGELLIEVHYSLVSAGTEAASLEARPPVILAPRLGERTGRAPGRGPLADALRLGLAAARRPRHALRRMAEMARRGDAGRLGPGEADAPGGGAASGVGRATGYSVAGVVRGTGTGVTRFVPGDRIAAGGAGYAHHAELVSVPENLCTRVPAEVSLRDACSVTLGAIALQGVRRADLRLGEVAALLGLGLIGQLTLQLLRESGVRVIAFDPDARRGEAARRLGFDACFSERTRFDRSVATATGAAGVDASIVAAASGSDEVCRHAMELTRRKGRVVLVGDVGLGLDRAAFYAKELDLLISCSYGPGRYDRAYEELGQDYPFAYVRWTENRNMALYLDLLSRGRVDFGSLVEHECPVERCAEAYASLRSGPERPIATVLRYAVSRDPVERPPSEPPRAAPAGTGVQRVALVGTGAFARSVLHPMFGRHPGAFRWEALVSRRGVRAGRLAAQLGIPRVAADLDQVFDDGIDSLCIATRHHLHARQVVAGLRAGKSVFCEKPLATSWEQLEQVAAAVQALPPPAPLLVGFNRRFAPAIRALLAELAGRRVPLVIQYRMNGGALPPGHWVNDERGAGRNIGEACHVYDLFAALTGSTPVAVSALALAPTAATPRPNENFAATLRFADGSLADLVYTSLGHQNLGKERMEVHSAGRSYVMEDYRALTRHAEGRDETLWSSERADKGHAAEIAAWAEFVTHGGGPPIPWTELLQATSISLWVEDLLFGRDAAHAAELAGRPSGSAGS